VDRLFQQSVLQKVRIRRKTINLLPKAMNGNERRGTVELRLTEDERENGNVQIETSHAENVAAAGIRERTQPREDFRRTILFATGIETVRRHGLGRSYLTKCRKILWQLRTEPLEQMRRHFSYRHQLNALHRESAVTFFQPYFFSLL